MTIFIYLLVLVIIVLADWFIAHTFYEIAQMKGHNERKYFWWSFVGLPGWFMVVALPDRNLSMKKNANNDELPEL